MNYLYNGKEWNNEGGLGWLDYGFRWYDPAVGRFPSVDPLAAKYAAISPYAYVANNPILNVDPDGMEIINADKLRLAQRKMRYDRFKASEKYQTYHGLTRKQAKDQFGKKGVKSWKYVKNTATKYEKVISKYEFRANKTDAIMKKWQKESPNLYKKIDGMSVDLYLGVDESVSSGREGDPFGATGSPIEENGKYIYKVGDLSVEGALPVFINSGVNMDSIDDETGEYSLNHEGGHFIFAVENPKQYFQDKRSIKAKGEDYNAGHHPDATTGKEAKKYGTKKDIEQ
jgi:RHS repeat-associated protein